MLFDFYCTARAQRAAASSAAVAGIQLQQATAPSLLTSPRGEADSGLATSQQKWIDPGAWAAWENTVP